MQEGESLGAARLTWGDEAVDQSADRVERTRQPLPVYSRVHSWKPFQSLLIRIADGCSKCRRPVYCFEKVTKHHRIDSITFQPSVIPVGKTNSRFSIATLALSVGSRNNRCDMPLSLLKPYTKCTKMK